MVVAVGEYIIETPIRGLSFLRDPSVAIHAVGLCRGCHSVGCGGERSGLGMCFCVGQGIGRSFAMVGGGLRRMLVIALSFSVCCVDFLMSQESMLTYIV